MKVKISDIIEALEFTDDTTHYFLDITTGEIVMVSEFGMDSEEQQEAYDRLDEHGFYRLPEQRDLNGYHTMEEFIDTLPPSMCDRLTVAISGRGAFRRFKDEIHRIGVEKDWYQYEEESLRNTAIEWCEENGIEYED